MTIWSSAVVVVRDKPPAPILGTRLFLTGPDEHAEAIAWLQENGITFRDTTVLWHEAVCGYDTMPCLIITDDTEAFVVMMRYK